MNKLFFPALSVFLFALSSCAYQFSNAHVVKPEGINSIAIEAVFDTSREVLPHEILWENLQKAFAKDGHLKIVSQKHADAILRAHLFRASINPTGGVTTTLPEQEKDPKVFDRQRPAPPSEFKQLTKAGEFTTNKSMAIAVNVEVWNLNTKKLIFQHTYSLKSSFPSVKSSRKGSVTTIANDYVRSEESLENSFRKATESIANKVVSDLLLR